MEGANTGGVGFEFGDLFFGEPAWGLEAVGDASVVEGLEAWEFFGFGGDDNFAADVVGYIFGAAEIE